MNVKMSKCQNVQLLPKLVVQVSFRLHAVAVRGGDSIGRFAFSFYFKQMLNKNMM